MIQKPKQPEDESQVIAYLRNITKQVIQARIDINEAWGVPMDGALDEIVPTELDRVTDAIVKLPTAWDDIFEKKFTAATEKAATAEELATKSAIRVWDELARIAYDNAASATKRKFIDQADYEKANRSKLEADKMRHNGISLWERDDYTAVDNYKKSVSLSRESKEDAELAKTSVTGRTWSTRIQIILMTVTVIAAIITVTVTSLRGCHQEPKQIPSRTTVPAETNKPNVTK